MGAEDGDSPFNFGTDFVELLDEESVHSTSLDLQQKVLPCYGRGKRLCDIQVPHIPLCCRPIQQLTRKDASQDSKMAPFLRRRGRGRAEALRYQTEDDQVRPGGLSSYGTTKQEIGPSPKEETQSLSFGWTIPPSPYVVQLDGLPADIDLEVLHDIVASYGTIVLSEVEKHNDQASIRFKFAERDACEFLVTNLDDTDFLGTGKMIRCVHFKS